MSFHGWVQCVFALTIYGGVLVGCDQRPAAPGVTFANPVKPAQAKSSLQQSIPQPSASDVTGASSALATDCAQNDYMQFFEDFVQLVDARKGYVSREVEVLNAENPSKQLGAIAREHYDGFRIGVVDSRWVYTNSRVTKPQDAPTIDVNVRQIDNLPFELTTSRRHSTPTTT